MKTLQATPETVHVGCFDARLRPVLEIDDGEQVRIGSISGLPTDDIPAEWVQPALAAIHAQSPGGGHIMTGPIWVNGALPGMVLEVEIQAVEPAAHYGYNGTRPLKGLLYEEFEAADRRIIPIDRERRVARFAGDIDIPLEPFFGVMGVAPPAEWGRVESAPPRKHGGNMDNKELRPGTRLFLPVWTAGALFSVGDGHGVQGDGEVNLSALETSLEGIFRLRLRKEFTLDLPLALTPEHLITMGFHEDLDRAAEIAVHTMIDILERHFGLARNDGYALCSMAVDLHVTQVVNGVKGIHAMLKHSLLSNLDTRAVFMDQQ